jgi:hypothetical protein
MHKREGQAQNTEVEIGVIEGINKNCRQPAEVKGDA